MLCLRLAKHRFLHNNTDDSVIQRVLRVEEGGLTARPGVEYGAELQAMRAQATTTPIESGSIDVRATVALTVEVLP